MGVQKCLCFKGNQYDITTSLMTMKTTTKRSKNQKISRNVREENVEANIIISFTQKTLYVID